MTTTGRFFSGVFLGSRSFDETIDDSQRIDDNELQWTLALTPTKDYPSIFGAGLHEPSPTIIHGVYQGTTQKGSMKEYIDGILTYEYQCELIVDRQTNKTYLHGTWKSCIDEKLFGKFMVVSNENISSHILSGIWVGQSDPDEQLADFLLPINPIRWCMAVVPVSSSKWILCGCGYFNDAADIPSEPLIFFSLDGQGTLEEMKMTKKYLKADYIVEYTGKFIRNDAGNYQFIGKWSNALAGSYGSFFADQFQLNPTVSYRLDICICEICTRIIYPGENRWCCFPCHFSTCIGCHLNSISRAHPHPLQVNILSSQTTAKFQSCYDLVESAFELFEKSPLLIYRHRHDQQLVRMTYGEIAMKCRPLAKYWKSLIGPTDNQHRPIILFMADSSPAYLCGLLAGLLCQAVVYPISGALDEDALVHILSTSQPSIVVLAEKYFEKFAHIFLSDNKRSITIIYPDEEQFGSKIVNSEKTKSLTEALREGKSSTIDLRPNCPLSRETISAIFCTSGSTGYPKGAIFTEDLLLPNDTFTIISPFVRIDYQSFDPVLLLSLMSTIKYGSCRGMTNLQDMWTDIKEIRPTSIGLTPSIWNNLYKEYLSKIRGITGNSDRENVARQIRENLGGRLIVGTTGGGSTSPTVIAFLRNQLKIDISDIYGCRECGNIARNGLIYPGVDVKLIPVPDLDLDGIDEGEICVHSPKIITGYYRLDRPSSFIEIEGKQYYRTGDIGKLLGRTIQLSDRSGTMIKNSMAEWISPVKIENIIEQLDEISSCFVVGDANYAHLGVIVCPSLSGSTFESIEMLQLIRYHCVHCGLTGPETPQCIYLEKDLVWNESNGLYKEKKCRSALAKHYSNIKTTIFTQQLFHHHQNNDQSLNSSFLDVLEKILNRPLNGSINGDNTFIEIGGDSSSLNLLCKAFHDQNIPMQPSVIYNHSLKHLELIFMKKLNIDDQMVENIDWNKEFLLPLDLKLLLSERSIKESQKNKHILLTGATGFLGPLLLYEILANTEKDVLVYCLIRANTVEQAEKRLKDKLAMCQREHLIDWNRIRCIIGCVSKVNFGLNIELYSTFVEQIGYVYHNASWVNIAMPYKSLKKTNVQGTLNALEFACRSHAKFIYTSSISALPPSNYSNEDSNGWVSLTPDEINKKDGYGQTKVVAEQLLKRASQLGADVIIIRPGTIYSDTVSGYSNLNDFINILLRSQIEMNACVNHANISFHLIPVDACAKAIVQLISHSEASGKCFDLFGKASSIALMYQAIIKRLPHLFEKKLEQSNWKAFVLENLSETSRCYPLRDKIATMNFVRTDHHSSVQAFSSLTQSHLGSLLDLLIFQITEQQIINSINFMIQSGFIFCQ